MKKIGAHVSVSGGVEMAPVNALGIGADAFALFTKNQRQWVAKPLSVESITLFKENCEKEGFDIRYILPHDSYLINLGHPEEEGLEKSRTAFLDEMQRCEELDMKLLNFHPGSHVGQGAEVGISKIAEILNEVLTKDQSTIVLLETMSGKGTEVGRNFEELRQIIDRVELKDKLGVCLDTCHVWDGGYDIVNDLDSVFEEFDRIIGLDRLKAIHLNDSMNPLGSHKDRHARIGEGEIGLEALVRVINHPATEGIPFILETPNDDEGWTHEIALLRNEYKQK